MVGFATCGPNEALVVSGMGYQRPRLIAGGRIFVLPFIQKVQRISLNIMTLEVSSPKIYTKFGVPISVDGVAQVKVESKPEMLHQACQQFLGKPPAAVAHIALETLEGHQRAIMGTMSVEHIYQDRQKFSEAVFEVASKDLVNMGITVVSYTIRNVADDIGYLRALGVARTAEVQRDAKIGEALAQRDSSIKEDLARQETQAAVFENKVRVAQSKRDYELKQAEFDIEVAAKKADADLATELQQAIVQQKIKSEEMGIMVVERTKRIQVWEQEIIRNERALDAEVRRPAKAEKFRVETISEAERKATIMRKEAEAEAIRARGEAEAFAINAKAQAEAEAMQKKAEAWAEYKDAAMVDMVLDILPKVAAEIAAPLSKAKIKMVSGPNGELGAGKITSEVLKIISDIPQAVQSLTGVDMSKAMKITASSA